MDGGFYFSTMAAMMQESRGIGYKGRLPWPYIKKDYDYYTQITTQVKDPAKKNIWILGRKTWDGTKAWLQENHHLSVNLMKVVISRSLRDQGDENVKVVSDFQAAVDLSEQLYNTGQIEAVWILGGEPVYTDAVQHPKCGKVYLTRVYKEYPTDTYFPKFEDDFNVLSESPIEDEVDGIKLQFFIYKRKCSSY